MRAGESRRHSNGLVAAACALGVALAMGGCGSTSSARQPRKVDALTPALRPVVEGNNAFAWSLYGAVDSGSDNLFFSPFSVSAALAMTYAGARGQTATEMKKVLHIETDDATFHAQFGALVRDLSGDRGRGYTLYVADRLFGQLGYAFHQDFLDLLKKDYAAELEPVDFSGDPDAARQSVNAWAENATKNTIPALFPPGSIDDTTRLVLADAIYFKAGWLHAFDPQDTQNAPFLLSDGTTVQVPMMYEDGSFATASDNLADVVELPYQDDEVSMILVVPAAVDGLPAVEAQLGTGWFDKVVSELGSRSEQLVGLPRFNMKWHASLGPVLKGLGMPAAFDPNAADFSGIANDSLYIQSVEHSAYVSVDEHGTTAAAATGVGMGSMSAPPQITADHPFLFVIRDRLTGSILFIGRVEDPR
jgi:serine protease inhibitor